jgi:pyruvate/2-oxoglutarate dehydrogenase complex dihydrolipoamide acyltransferase (E2) component
MAEDAPSSVAADGSLRSLSPVRRVVARRMAEAWRTIPAVTLHRTATFDALLGLRERSAEHGRRPTIDAILAKAVALGLVDHELLNGSWVEDRRAVLVHPSRNVAVAVDTPRGLSAVVLRGADARSIEDLDEDLRSMVDRAREGRSTPGDLAGATFTITNLGALGVESFNPIITPPQSGVLGIGAAALSGSGGRRAVLSLTFDHRVADGADAARCLGRIVALIEEPDAWSGLP